MDIIIKKSVEMFSTQFELVAKNIQNIDKNSRVNRMKLGGQTLCILSHPTLMKITLFFYQGELLVK